MPELMANAVKSCLGQSDKPILAYISPHAPDLLALFNANGVPAYMAPESCAAALGAMTRVARWRPSQTERSREPAVLLDDLPSGSLDEAQAKQLFARFGIQGVKEAVVTRAGEATRAATTFGVPSGQVAARLSIMANDVEAKTGGKPTRFLIQEMVAGGVEMILGLRRDALGTAILLGAGGIQAELFRDTALRFVPPAGVLSRDEALAMAQELKIWPLLDGFRGRPRADVEALVSAIVAFSRMASQLGAKLVEAEINPIFVLPTGQGVRAADGVAILLA